MQKITPFLWFDGQAEEAMNFYTSIFNPHSARNGRVKTITKQAQGGDSNVGREEKRNSKCECEEETN